MIVLDQSQVVLRQTKESLNICIRIEFTSRSTCLGNQHGGYFFV